MAINIYDNYNNRQSELQKLYSLQKEIGDIINREQGLNVSAPVSPQWVPNENCYVYGNKEVWCSFLEQEIGMSELEFNDFYNLYCEDWIANQNKFKEDKKQAYRNKIATKGSQSGIKQDTLL